MKKVAIVTGGLKGLGKVISIKLRDSGYKVYALSRNQDQKLEGITFIKTDVSTEKDCKDAVDGIIKKEKRIDLLINNAGIIFTDKGLNASESELLNVFKVNVFGSYYLAKHTYPFLKKTSGKIVNITSLNGLVPVPNASIYSASKHALEAIGISLSYEFAREGISITNVAPGAIHNPGAEKLYHKTLRERFPILKICFPMVTQEKVGEMIIKVAESEHPPKRVIVGLDAQVAFFVSRTLPTAWFFVLGKLYSK